MKIRRVTNPELIQSKDEEGALLADYHNTVF
jgi:hypothetical protein